MIIRKTYGGGVKGLIDRIKDFGKPKVYIGVPSIKNPMHKDSGVNMATLLAIHTLGAPTRGIPARDALRPPLIANSKRYTDLIKQGLLNAKADGTDAKLVYEKIGLVASNDVKEYFVGGQFAPLKQATIDRKGSSKPLIDTGELRSSITYEVRK